MSDITAIARPIWGDRAATETKLPTVIGRSRDSTR